MKTLEEIKNDELRDLQVMEDLWKNDEKGLDNYWVMQNLAYVEHAKENIDEFVQRRIAQYAQLAVDGLSKDDFGKTRWLNGANELGLHKDDPIVSKLQLDRLYGPAYANSGYVQGIYESYGFTDILPTEMEIRNLERKRKELDRNSETYRIDANKLDKEIAIAKARSGLENMNSYFATVKEISELYDKQLQGLTQSKENVSKTM